MVGDGPQLRRIGTLVLSGLGLAVTTAWLATGARLPSSASGARWMAPLAKLIVDSDVERIRPVAAAITWIVAVDVVLLSGLAAIMVFRARRNRAAQQLAVALAMFGASLSVLFQILTLPPFEPWLRTAAVSVLPDLPHPRPPWPWILTNTAMSVSGFALLGGAMWRLVRFWNAYPNDVDREVLATFFRVSGTGSRTWLSDSVRAMAARLAPARRASDTPGQAVAGGAGSGEGSDADAAELVARDLTSQRMMDSRSGNEVFLQCAVGAAFWAAGSFWGSFDVGFGLFSLVAIAAAIRPTSLGIRRLVAFQQQFADAAQRRAIEWIGVAGAIERFLLVHAPLLLWMVMVLVGFATETLDVRGGIGGPALGLFLLAVAAPFAMYPAILALALGASIFARGLVDPRLALKGITFWTLLGLIVTVVFLLVERFVALQVVRWLALPAESGALIAGATIAATFLPIRRAAEKWVAGYVERWMPTRLLAAGDRHVGAMAVVDISGFTALSARDEAAALLAVALLQKAARQLADAHQGRVVKFTGDGALLAFESAAAAVGAVRGLHAAFGTGTTALGLPVLTLHSGLHWGEYVAVRDTDIFGHAVNLVTRVAEAANPGEMLATAEFAHALGTVDPPPRPVGPRTFKNVSAPIECYRLA